MSWEPDLQTRLRRLLEEADGRAAPGAVHPAEIAARITREAGLACRAGPGGPVSPNRFAVRLPTGALRSLPRDQLLRRVLEQSVEETARERGWRLTGPARVRMETDPSLPPATMEVTSAVRPGRRPPWAILRRLEQRLPLTVNRCLIGRSGAADLTIPHRAVSGIHALLWQEGGGIWVEDRGSARGTFVDGRRITGRTALPVGGGIAFGSLEYRLEAR